MNRKMLVATAKVLLTAGLASAEEPAPVLAISPSFTKNNSTNDSKPSSSVHVNRDGLIAVWSAISYDYYHFDPRYDLPKKPLAATLRDSRAALLGTLLSWQQVWSIEPGSGPVLQEGKKESDPNRRVQELLNTSEDSGPIEFERERIWYTDKPSHLTPERTHSGIQ